MSQLVADDPAAFTTGALRASLEKAGVTVDGRVTLGSTPSNATEVAARARRQSCSSRATTAPDASQLAQWPSVTTTPGGRSGGGGTSTPSPRGGASPKAQPPRSPSRRPTARSSASTIRIAVLSDCQGAFGSFDNQDLAGVVTAMSQFAGAKAKNPNTVLGQLQLTPWRRPVDLPAGLA